MAQARAPRTGAPPDGRLERPSRSQGRLAWDNPAMGFFDRFRRRSAPPVTPQFDDAVAKRLEAAGKRPDRVQAVPAEATAIPRKPDLPGFSGTVKLELTLDEQGAVRAVSMDGAPAAAVAELEAWAHAWTFRPAAMDGKAHPCRMVFEVTWS